jgi:hypothetical protein
MPNVEPTTLTTTDPGDAPLTLCDGFAMFPWLGTVRAKTAVDDEAGTFFEKTLNLEIFRISLAATHTAFVGVCGPAYAVELDTTAATSYTTPAPGQPASGTLVIGDHGIRGGFQAGIDFQIGIGVDITANYVFGKKKLVNVDADIDIDVIELIYELIISLLQGGGGGQAEGDPNDFELSTFSESGGPMQEFEVEEGEPAGESPGGEGGKGVRPEFTGSGMVDYIPKPFLPPPGQTFDQPPSATLEPTFGLAFSIVPLFADIPFLDVLYALDEALEAIGGGFELGPMLNVGLPTTVTLKGATISNHPFDIVESSASGSGTDATASFTLSEQTPVDPHLQPLGATADEIGVLLEHEVGVEVGLSFFAELTFFKVAHVGASTGVIPLFYSHLPDGAGGPFDNHLSFVPGGGPVPFSAPTTAPTVGRYTANQPQGAWSGGVLAQYGVSFYDDDYETPIGPFTALDPQKRFYAFPELSDIPIGPAGVTGRRIYRLFNDGSEPLQVGDIPDNTTTTFTDTAS